MELLAGLQVQEQLLAVEAQIGAAQRRRRGWYGLDPIRAGARWRGA